MRVFISWSGSRSKLVAESLRDWLPNVIQSVEPWVSASDIEKGARWSADVARELEQTQVGIICLTSDNLNRPWILFEAGALSKTLDNTFVCPYLLDIGHVDIKGPLSQFQLTLAQKDDTKRLVRTINIAQGDIALPEARVDTAFERFWPDLEKQLAGIPAIEGSKAPPRPEREILEEILDLVRAQSRAKEDSQPNLFLLPNELNELESGGDPLTWTNLNSRILHFYGHGTPATIRSNKVSLTPFRKLALEAYNRRCAISGEKTFSTLNVVHIKPRAQGGTSQLQNLIVLRKDLSELFIQGLLTFDEDYKVILSTHLDSTDYDGYRGKLINLPGDSDLYPSQEALEFHRQHVFKS